MQKFGVGIAGVLLFACDLTGTCKVGDDESCPLDAVCYGGERASHGANGICALGELSPEGKLVPKLKEWRLLLSNQVEVAPLREEGSTADNPQAGWVGTGAARVEALVLGLKLGEKLEAWVGQPAANVECKYERAADNSEGELWACVLREGWATAAPEAKVEVRLKPGEGIARTRTYRVDTQPPLIGLSVFLGTRCFIGDNSPCEGGQNCMSMFGNTQGIPGICQNEAPTEFRAQVCAKAQDRQSNMLSLQTQTPTLTISGMETEDLSSALGVEWQKVESTTPYSECWAAQFPFHLNQAPSDINGDMGRLLFSMEVEAVDRANNRFNSKAYGGLERVLCSTQVEQISDHALKAPLAFAGGRLVWGTSMGEGALPADNSLYFVNPETCEVDSTSTLHTGALQGPMVVFNNTRIALALGGGGPEGRRGPRLAVVDNIGAGSVPGFRFDEDCTPGAGGSAIDATFNQGLSLLSMVDTTNTTWRFAAPANSATESASRLMAYVPSLTTGDACVTDMSHEGGSHPLLTPAQHSDSSLAIAYGTNTAMSNFLLNDWSFDVWDRRWSLERALSEPLYPLSSLYSKNPAGTAVGGGQQLWLSGDGLFFVRDTHIRPAAYFLETIVDEQWRTSPAAVDSQGRAYVVVQTPANTYEVQRFASGTGRLESKSASLYEAPVGSPILGQPLAADSEVYLVTTQGTVLAFNADTLELLWRQSLGMQIAPTAQPLLLSRPAPFSGGTLWAISNNGEIRGVRVGSPMRVYGTPTPLQVGSSGLSRTAHWPKAFHDNCNTSSRMVTHSNTPNCF
ncbi:MAG: PQQ-like beta-propeller repeat protein [Cystobacterineae bacterium]|nr:PQQ-like beta-propeller repeat protein [Cystobacterineae bacterium]